MMDYSRIGCSPTPLFPPHGAVIEGLDESYHRVGSLRTQLRLPKDEHRRSFFLNILDIACCHEHTRGRSMRPGSRRRHLCGVVTVAASTSPAGPVIGRDAKLFQIDGLVSFKAAMINIDDALSCAMTMSC